MSKSRTISILRCIGILLLLTSCTTLKNLTLESANSDNKGNDAYYDLEIFEENHLWGVREEDGSELLSADYDSIFMNDCEIFVVQSDTLFLLEYDGELRNDLRPEIFRIVERMPVYREYTSMESVEAFEEFKRDVDSKLEMTKKERQSAYGKSGLLDFIINRCGEVKEVNVIKSITPTVDWRIKSIIEDSKWIPGQQNDFPVNVSMWFPYKVK